MADLARIRTDVVGSLLRPDYLKEAYRQHGRGELDDSGLRAVQDRAIREGVALQEAVGLDVLTDGEYRRLNFQDSFGACVAGYDADADDIDFHETGPRRPAAQPLRLPRERSQAHRWCSAGRSTSGCTCAQPAARGVPVRRSRSRSARKVTLIGPDRIGQRWDRERSTRLRRPRRLPGRRRARSSARWSRGSSTPAAATSTRRARLYGLRRRAVDRRRCARAARTRTANFASSLRGRQRADRRTSPALPSASTSAAATSAACGTARAATTPSPSGCSAS